MTNLYANVPTSNSEFNPDIKLGKVVPIFVAQSLQASEQSIRVDLWNNSLVQEMQGLTEGEYLALARERLQRKYNSQTLKWLGNLTVNPLIISDTDQDFTQWAKKRIEESLVNGDVVISDTEVYICSNCAAHICLAEGQIPSCSTCPNSRIEIKTTKALITNVTPEVLTTVNTLIGDVSAANGLSVRGKFLISKMRVAGVPLETIGLPGEVLDNRVALGLLALYAAEKTDASAITLVSAISNQTHNLPQFIAALKSQLKEHASLKIVGIPKVPVEYLQYLVAEDIFTRDQMNAALFYKLAPRLPGMRRDVTPETAERIIFSRAG